MYYPLNVPNMSQYIELFGIKNLGFFFNAFPNIYNHGKIFNVNPYDIQ